MSPSLAASAALANSWLSMRYSARARRRTSGGRLASSVADLALGELHVGFGDLLAVDRDDDLGAGVLRLGGNVLRREGRWQPRRRYPRGCANSQTLDACSFSELLGGPKRRAKPAALRVRATGNGRGRPAAGPWIVGPVAAAKLRIRQLEAVFCSVCAALRSVSDALTSLWCGPYLSPAAEIHASQALQARSAAVCCLRGPVNLGC